MGIKDFFITPIYLILFTLLALFIRPYVTNKQTRKYFLPALWVRFAGAIALGLIYQFYYGGGDTFNYYEQAKIIYEALINEPYMGFKLLRAQGEFDPELLGYTSRIYWFKASSEYFIIKLVAFFSIFTFNTYSTTAIFFAMFSFCGSWSMFAAVQKKYPEITIWIAASILLVPSCIFWGTGILKDTITLGSLGFLFWSLYQIIEERRFSLFIVFVMLFSAWFIYSIKIYILLCFIPSVVIWWYLKRINSIRNQVLKIAVVPILMLIFVGGGYLMLEQIASTSERYKLESLAEWSYITSYDIRFYTGKGAGSGYDLGTQDGTWQTLIKLLPAGINVSLFRPYIWEVRNPLMVLSAVEALLISVFTFLTIFRFQKKCVISKSRNPMIVMMLSFSLVFAFAVGVSTYNFGSLSRYKIPLLPFYTTSIFILYHWHSIYKIRRLSNMKQSPY